MFFLLRAAFWMSVVILLMPTGESKPTPNTTAVSAANAISAAAATVSDVSQFCERRAEACVAGLNAAAAIGQRAQTGAKMVYDLLTEAHSPAETGSVAARPNVVAGKPSQHTLKPSDAVAPYRVPVPRPEPSRKQPAA